MTLSLRAFFGFALVLAWMGLGAVAQAQQPPAQGAGATFLTAAQSSAFLQQQASQIAAAADVRPEVKQFASEMAAFRAAQLQRLATLVAEQRGGAPSLNFEQQVLIDNLKPLDFLALSRRYMELEVQALEQEVREYESARAQTPSTEPLVAEYLPQLTAKLAKAREVLEAARS